MPESTVRALVLRRSDSGESDRRLTLLTEAFGKLDVIARGARKAGSRLAAASEPAMLATLTYASGRHRRFVTQVQPVTTFPGLRGDYDRLCSALAYLEVIGALLPYESPNEQMFQSAISGLAQLEKSDQPVAELAHALFAIFDHEGQSLQLEACVDSGEAADAQGSVLVSPSAGGVISVASAAAYRDAFLLPGALYRTLVSVQKGSFPENADQAIGPLYRFARHLTGIKLPALRLVVESVFRHDAQDSLE